MQHALLRIALVLGAEVLPDLSFKGLAPDAAPGKWKATFGPRKSQEVTAEKSFDSIVDASGVSAVVADSKVCGGTIFEEVTQGGNQRKVALTANFNRFKGD